MCVICVLCLIVLQLPPGKNLFEVKINNNENNDHLSTGAGTIGQLVADVPSALSHHPIRRN
jgi:hypothetical protein